MKVSPLGPMGLPSCPSMCSKVNSTRIPSPKHPNIKWSRLRSWTESIALRRTSSSTSITPNSTIARRSGGVYKRIKAAEPPGSTEATSTINLPFKLSNATNLTHPISWPTVDPTLNWKPYKSGVLLCWRSIGKKWKFYRNATGSTHSRIDSLGTFLKPIRNILDLILNRIFILLHHTPSTGRETPKDYIGMVRFEIINYWQINV